jgi:SAM-dependent methyltransferase
LDIGCAAGGSALFSREVNDNITYVGIDISKDLLDAAVENLSNLPNTKFFHFDGQKIPLENDSIDFVFSFGVFHHLNEWNHMLIEALRVSNKYVLFDLRLWHEDSMVGSERSYQKLALGGSWDGVSILPYNILSFNELFELARQLNQSGISCKAFGYYQEPTHSAVTPAKRVLMMSILLEKGVHTPIFEVLIS